MADDDVQGTDNGQDVTDDVTTDVDVDKADGGDTKPTTVSQSDYDKLFARMQAADRAKTAAEHKLSEIEKAKLGEVDRLKVDVEELTKENDQLKTQLQTVRIENAFYRENKHTWHDPADALSFLDMSSVTIGEDGKVEGLKSAIDDVAKRKPHLVKKDTGPEPVASGEPVNGTRKGDKPESGDMKALAKRFPALRK
jgi:FtsZ-binding cell division protein ZapB